MRTKKIYIIAILIAVFYLFFSLNSIVKANITWNEIKDKYEADKTLSFLKGEENKKELENWQKEVKATILLIQNTVKDFTKNEDYIKAMEISAALETVNSANSTDETDEELINNYKTHNDIRNWLKAHDGIKLSSKVKEAWISVVENDSKSSENSKKVTIKMINGKKYSEASAEVSEENLENSKPSTGVLGNTTASSTHTPDEVIKEADGFIQAGKDSGNKINPSNLKNASNTLYNILLTIGIFLAVGIGMYLGIKFMLSSAEDRAKVKESLIPYIAGCVIIFGAFIIWKLAITLLANLA